MTLIISYYLSFIVHSSSSQLTFLVLILLCCFGTTTTNVSQQQPIEHRHRAATVEYLNHIDNKHYNNPSPVVATNRKTDESKFHQRRRRQVDNNETRILDLSKRNLTQLTQADNVNNLKNVVLLNVSNNLLTTFNINNLNNFPNLQTLDLSSNFIEEFYLATNNSCNSNNSVISEINLSGNLIRKFLTTVKICNLNSLNLSHNKLNNSNHVVLTNIINLKILDLSYNQLKQFDGNLFANLTNLIEINLSYNQLSELHANLFYHLKNLEILNLSNNDISHIDNDTFTNLSVLQYLDLSGNKIQLTSLRALQGIPDLIGLSIEGNYLLADGLQGFVESWSIKELDISDIGLCRVPYALAQSVRILNLRDNYLNVIESGDFESYPLLHRLTLSSNRIVAVEEDALGRLEMLTILYLDHNNLTQIPSSLPSSLIQLYLNLNQITDIQPTNLINLENLATLDLSGNRILYLPQLPPLHRLITLNLKSCGLKGINRMIVDTSPNLRDLLLDDNPIKCEELYGLAEWVSFCVQDKLPISDDEVTSTSSDGFDYDANDNEAKERYQNSIAFFVHSGIGIRKGDNDSKVQRLAKCLNEEKLITSLNLTNDARHKANDNKFTKNIISSVTRKQQQQMEQILNDGNEKDFSNKTSLINKNRNKAKNNVPSSESDAKMLENSIVKVKIPVSGKKSIKQLENEDIKVEKPNNNNKNGLNKMILMKHKQKTNRSQININSLENSNSNSTNNILNRNLIKFNKGNYENRQQNETNNKVIEFYVNGSGNTSTVNMLNQTISSQEQWNDVRTTNESNNHPGLLIVIGISIGVLLTFVLINIYRCNCQLRQHYTMENFNDKNRVHSEDILTEHEHQQQSSSNSTTQRDLLPMDILNSTLSQTVDSPNMSLLW